MSNMPVKFRSIAVIAALTLFAAPATAQLTRLQFAGLPTNLHADWSQVFWAPAPTPGEFFLLAPFGGTSAGRCTFQMFAWDGHPMMQAWFPNGWYEARFAFPQWAYLSNAPCGLQPPPHLPVPNGGVDSTYDYGPPLFTGPIVGIHQPLPGWVLGDVSVPWVGGHPTTAISESFALFLTDYWGTTLNACVGETPVSWVAVRVRLSLIAH